jgi:CRISPR-associated protein Cst2
MTAITSISLAARATLNMHSLNNEGGEGNQIQTRMIDIVGDDGNLYNVNGISGDMLKHIQMEHFYQRARELGVGLCESCQRFNANRINASKSFLEKTAGISDIDFIDQLLQTCAIDDAGGILITEGKRSIPRKSVSEFGWVVALPDTSRTESYLHVKYVSERGAEKRKEDADGQKTGANLGQSLFHRPASSGIYAIVCHLELSRIGYNDIKQEYAIDRDERQRRLTLLLESILYTFVELNGAMRSTQLPHLVALEGLITTSSGSLPAPLVSPLAGGSEHPRAYREQAEGIIKALNGRSQEIVQMRDFDSLSAFAGQMRDLIDAIEPTPLLAAR